MQDVTGEAAADGFDCGKGFLVDKFKIAKIFVPFVEQLPRADASYAFERDQFQKFFLDAVADAVAQMLDGEREIFIME